MVDVLFDMFNISLTITTFSDLFIILIRMFSGLFVLRVFFNFISDLIPGTRRSVFRGML